MSAPPSRQAVLVVEDESLVRMFAVDVLEDEGYEVIEASDAQQALAELKARPDIKLVFTDINMPGAMDGVELAREIARTMPGVHVILTSGKYLSRADEIPVATPFVTKPYTAHQLIGLMEQILLRD
jgi:two-component system, response regulator PdtaR